MDELARITSGLREPSDYFAGTGDEPWCWPRNLIAFTRMTRLDLQRRTFESRLHARYVLVVNLGTAGTLNLDSTRYRLRPGECHLIFPHQLHTYRDVDQEDILWLFVTFELPDGAPLHRLRHTTLPLGNNARRMLRDFLTAYLAKKKSAHRLQTLLSGILLHLVEQAERPGTRAKVPPGGDNRLLRAIHRHHARSLPDALTVQQLSALLGLSESRLRTRFRSIFGHSLGQYLRSLRLQEAAGMMRHSEASLTEIALSCGFGSSSAFSRSFRKWAGTTPRAFRGPSPVRSAGR